MKPKEPAKRPQNDLFRMELENLIDRDRTRTDGGVDAEALGHGEVVQPVEQGDDFVSAKFASQQRSDRLGRDRFTVRRAVCRPQRPTRYTDAADGRPVVSESHVQTQ